MPINPIVLQRRHAELGRIRLGNKGDRGQPQKLTQFRFTSPHQRHVTDLASIYGGQAQPWRNGTREEWEVYTTAKSIPVVVVRGGMSQWMETWSGGGCVHRCDGVRNVLTDTPCDPDDPAHQAAKPTTRLSVMLTELDAIGVWRLESHGWNAAAELPSMVELAQHVADLVPARLLLSERVQIKDGRTSRFVVPSLDLEVSPARLTAIVSGQPQHLGPQAIEQAPQQRAIEHQPPAAQQQSDVDDDITDAIADCATAEEARELWNELKARGALTEAIAARITAHVAAIKAEEQPSPAGGTTDEAPGWVTDDGAPAAPQGDVDALWQEAVAQAGRLGWSLAALQGEFEGYHAIPVADATPEQLASFVHALKTGEIGQQAVSA